MPFPLAPELIHAAEQALGATLPSSYKAAMQRANGGELMVGDEVWDQYPIEDTSDRKRLARTSNHVLKETLELNDWAGFPSGALAIAGNGTGDQLVLIRVGPIYGDSVYAWSHETGELTKVASDFAQLVSQ
jgi:SMI1-KNR4 cell-wall